MKYLKKIKIKQPSVEEMLRILNGEEKIYIPTEKELGKLANEIFEENKN